MSDPRRRNAPAITAPRGTTLNAWSWTTEAPLRMLMNNLDPEVAERPDELVVYGGIGRAARDWRSFDTIVSVLDNVPGRVTESYINRQNKRIVPGSQDASR